MFGGGGGGGGGDVPPAPTHTRTHMTHRACGLVGGEFGKNGGRLYLIARTDSHGRARTHTRAHAHTHTSHVRTCTTRSQTRACPANAPQEVDERPRRGRARKDNDGGEQHRPDPRAAEPHLGTRRREPHRVWQQRQRIGIVCSVAGGGWRVRLLRRPLAQSAGHVVTVVVIVLPVAVFVNATQPAAATWWQEPGLPLLVRAAHDDSEGRARTGRQEITRTRTGRGDAAGGNPTKTSKHGAWVAARARTTNVKPNRKGHQREGCTLTEQSRVPASTRRVHVYVHVNVLGLRHVYY